MVCLTQNYFFDIVEGKQIALYVDKYGQKWMCKYPFKFWSFRVKSTQI